MSDVETKQPPQGSKVTTFPSRLPTVAEQVKAWATRDARIVRVELRLPKIR